MSENKQRFEEIKSPDEQRAISHLEQCVIDGDIDRLVNTLKIILKKVDASTYRYNVEDSVRAVESDQMDLIMCRVLGINIIVPTKGFIGWLEAKRGTDEWLNEDVGEYLMALLSGEVVRYRMFVPDLCYGIYRCSVYLEGA